MSTKRTKKGDTQQAVKAGKKPRPSESKKLRPQSSEGLALAIQQNRLDNRTRAAQDMVALRDAIASNPQEAAKGLVRDTLAANATIMTAVLRELTGPGVSIIGADGAIHPLIAKTWPDLQRATLSAARVLASLERDGTGQPATTDDKPSEIDISTLILEAQRDADSI